MIKLNSNYKYKSLADVSAPILPGKSIGGIYLNTNLTELKDWLLYNYFIANKDQLAAKAFNGVFIEYSVLGVIELIADVTESRIVRIGCKEGYLGYYNNLIRPGIFLSDLLTQSQDFEILNGTIINKNIPGIEFEIPEELSEYDTLSDLPNFIIKRLYVTPI